MDFFLMLAAVARLRLPAHGDLFGISVFPTLELQ